MGLGPRLSGLAPGIGKEAKRPSGSNRGIKLAQATGGAVTRVGKDLAARLFLALVKGGKILLAHVDLTAHVKDARHSAFNLFR